MNGLLERPVLIDSAKVVALLVAVFLGAAVVAGVGTAVVVWLYVMVV